MQYDEFYSEKDEKSYYYTYVCIHIVEFFTLSLGVYICISILYPHETKMGGLIFLTRHELSTETPFSSWSVGVRKKQETSVMHHLPLPCTYMCSLHLKLLKATIEK